MFHRDCQKPVPVEGKVPEDEIFGAFGVQAEIIQSGWRLAIVQKLSQRDRAFSSQPAGLVIAGAEMGGNASMSASFQKFNLRFMIQKAEVGDLAIAFAFEDFKIPLCR